MSPQPIDPHAACVIAEAFDTHFREKNGGIDDIIRAVNRQKARLALEALRDADYAVVFVQMDGT